MSLINFVLIRLDTQHLQVNRQDNYTPLLKYWLIAGMEQNGAAERHRVETVFYLREISAEFLMRKIYRLLLLCLVTLISACQPVIENSSTQPFSNSVQPYPPATLQFLSSAARNANPTSVPTQALTEAQPAATLSPGQGSSFNNDPGLYSSSTAEVLPAIKPGNDVPSWGIIPQRTVIKLLGYPISSHLFKPQITLYPVAEFRSISSRAAGEIASLQTLLKNKPQDLEKLPFLPFFEAQQQIHARLKYMDFKNGTGVRFLTQYDQAYLPINNNELIYTFQGITDDGKWYVSAILPVNHFSLPADGTVTPDLAAAFEKDFPKYIADTAGMLNNQPDASFTPDLSRLDGLMASLEVQ
jgi:hypothetical protein